MRDLSNMTDAELEQELLRVVDEEAKAETASA